MDLATVLQNAQSPDNNIRGQAEQFISQAIETQYGPFLLALTVEFATENRPEYSRQVAGLCIKNMLDAKDNNIYAKKLEKWNTCDHATKTQAKAGFLQALQSPFRIVNRTAAQVIGVYGAVEFPNKSWPELLDTLLVNISTNKPLETKVASLESLGYMCDSMDPELVESADVNKILTAIIDSLKPENPDAIREAAVIALYNSLDFTSKNFEVQAERDVIVNAICVSTASPNMKIRQKAFECIAKLPDLYYDKIMPYIETFYKLTTHAMASDVPEVAAQAVEFWTTVALYELGVLEDIDEGIETPYAKIIEQAAKPIIPMLLQILTKQQDDPDDDTPSYIADSGATCLDAISRILCDNVVDEILPFISANIGSADWHFKEAAVTAFGCILDGPSSQKMAPILSSALPVLIGCYTDKATIVRGSVGWTLGRICELHKDCISMSVLPSLVTALLTALEDTSANVASRACFAIHNLASACADEADNPTNVLSHFLMHALTKLFVVATRPDWNESNLRLSAYEASNMLISSSAKDQIPIINEVLTEALNRLETAMNPAIEAQERLNLQSHLCSLVGECIKKLETEQLVAKADRIMHLLLQVFNVRTAIAHDDAFFAISFLADKLQGLFTRYLNHTKEPLLIGLRNFEEYQVCIVALGCVGDICRAINQEVYPICDDILNAVLEILRSNTVDRSVKPHAISVFADIAMAIGGYFEKYAAVVLGILQQASTVMPANADDEGEIEYINALRVSILESYTGIAHTLADAGKLELMTPYVDTITAFMRLCAEDEEKDDELTKTLIGIIGDFAKVFGGRVVNFLNDPVITKTIQEASGYEEFRQLTHWAQSMIMGVNSSRK